MTFAFISAKKAEHRRTTLPLYAVTRSGFYACNAGYRHAQRGLVLRTKLRTFHSASCDRDGRPRP